jgi:sulfite exporter TauE/SafE/copper chaperone CopZ
MVEGPHDVVRVTLPVTGMTCGACERRVSRSLQRVPGVQDAAVSARRGTAVITVDGEVPWDGIASAVEDVGYTVGRAPWITRDPGVWRRALVAGAAVAVVAWLLFGVGLGQVRGSLDDPGAGGLLVVALLGLTAGVSTCAALVGGLVLAVSAQRAQELEGRPSWRPHLVFHAGRVVGFFVLGALLGAVGARLSLPDRAQALLIAVVGVFLVLLGLRLTGLSPRMAGWSLALPERWSRGIRADADGPYSDVRAALLGAATFVLPCGFTQIVQLYAMTTGSPLRSGLVMAVFALGTVPGLLALAGLPMVAGGARRERVMAVAGVALVVFAAVNLASAAGLAGLTTPHGAAVTASGVSPNVALDGGVQVVRMFQGARGYTPAATVVYADVPIRWEITSESEFTCASALRGDNGFSVNLKTGENVISLPAMAPGTFAFTCTMGMYSGSLTAVPVKPPAST